MLWVTWLLRGVFGASVITALVLFYRDWKGDVEENAVTKVLDQIEQKATEAKERFRSESRQMADEEMARLQGRFKDARAGRQQLKEVLGETGELATTLQADPEMGAAIVNTYSDIVWRDLGYEANRGADGPAGAGVSEPADTGHGGTGAADVDGDRGARGAVDSADP